jgi:hypothetical protein
MRGFAALSLRVLPYFPPWVAALKFWNHRIWPLLRPTPVGLYGEIAGVLPGTVLIALWHFFNFSRNLPISRPKETDGND